MQDMLGAASPGRGYAAAPADDLCLAFADTLYWRGTAQPAEELRGIEDLLDWVASNGGVDPASIAQARAGCRSDPAFASSLLAAAVRIREAIYGIFAAAASGREPPQAGWRVFDAALHAAPPRSSLHRHEGRCVWTLDSAGPPVETLLAGVLWSAADLLAGRRLGRVRLCANERCGWVFLDDSKSANRRWCSMSACGNRAKAHRHYRRSRTDQS